MRSIYIAALAVLPPTGHQGFAGGPAGHAVSTHHLTPTAWIAYMVVMLLLLVLIAFFSSAETALLNVRDSRIAQLVEEGNRRAMAVERLKAKGQRMLVTIQIVVTLVTTLASSLATSVVLESLTGVSRAVAIAIATLFVLLILSLFGEITPKNWALGNSERWALFTAPVVLVTNNIIVAPLSWALESLSAVFIRLFGGAPSTAPAYATEQEIKLIVEEAAGFGELQPEEKEMIHNVMEIPGITAREIMTPRIQVIGVERNTPIDEVAAVIVREGHTRLPVYDGTIDNIIGILHAKDLLSVLAQPDQPASIEQLMRAPIQIPESKKVDKLLKDFKTEKSQMAVVLDEHGGTAGLVTMEDVLEEIVGPIDDEYDEPEEKPIQHVSPGEYLVLGNAPLPDVCELLDFRVADEDEHDTIGGFVFGLLGRAPEVGDSVEYEGWRFIVEDVEGRRIEHLRMIHLQQQQHAANSETIFKPEVHA
ncbi:MAG TPA: hemolysin family protein [Armatimonadota bacterium]|nr:hemolysin family protein [Armatimonadota bacterium]